MPHVDCILEDALVNNPGSATVTLITADLPSDSLLNL